MADIYLFPAEANATDVRLREPAADTPAVPPALSRGGGFVRPRPRPRPVPVTRQVHMAVQAHCQPTITLAVDHAGRRHQEDELVLVGAL